MIHEPGKIDELPCALQHLDRFLEPHILLFRRSLKVSQQVQQQRAAAAAAQAQQQQYNTLHMK